MSWTLRALAIAALAVALAGVGIATPAEAAGIYRDFPAPYGYWSFDRCDGSTAYDAALAPRNATLSGGAYCSSSGRFGRSGYFDGNNDLVTVSNSTGVNLDRLTVSAWVYPFSTSGSRTIVNKWYVLDSWMLGIDNGNYTFTVVFPGGSWGSPVTISTPASTYKWQHVAGSYDGATLRLYVDGVLKASTTAYGSIQDSTRPITIGSHPSWNTFYGYIDEVKLYDVALAGTDVARLATAPSANGIRGIHLMPSQWVQPNGADANAQRFDRDLGRIHSIGNLSSIKTSIFSYKNDPSRSFWLDQQRQKLSHLKSATGNHVTWILRAWPTTSDCVTASYQCGYDFARDLGDVLNHIQNTLKLQNVYIEVGNEPNHSSESLFYHPDFNVNTGRYNDFFRGFYWGQQSLGYVFPLVYAGLTPGCQASGYCSADAWYQDYWVRDHIQQYATKVGVHVYWDSTVPSAWNGRDSESGGKYYRRVKNLLAGGYSPAVSPKGLQMTEFNFNRHGGSLTTQAAEFCQWWKNAASDAAAGWWVEQSTLFVTETEDGSFASEYWLDDTQLDDVRDCQ